MPVQSAYASNNNNNNNNSGDIKVHEPGTDSELNNNDPKLSGCSVQVDFYNFNNTTDKNATVSFTSQAPTASAGILVSGASLTPVVIGDGDADGQGNNDLDGSYIYTLGFTGTPAAQGYHVDLDVVVGSPNGGSKQKVFWAPASCRAKVAATAPSISDLCEVKNDTYTIPATPHVIYKVNGSSSIKPAGTYSANGASSVSVQAFAIDGYVLDGQASWTLNFTNSANCEKVVDLPEPPTTIDECGLDNIRWNTASYQDTDDYTWTVNQDGSLTVTTVVGVEFPNEQTSKTYYLPKDNGIKCAPTTDPTKNDTCGTKNDTYTIPEAEGVVYYVNGVATEAGTYNGYGFVKITAEAQEGYKLLGHDYWKFHFSDRYCKPDVKAWLKTFCYGDGQYFKLGVKNNTDSKQKYEIVVTDSEGNEVKQSVVYLHSGQYDAGSWMTNVDDEYTFSVYSYNYGKRGELLWEKMIVTECATDVFTPDIYKRDQNGNLLPGAKFTIEVCQYGNVVRDDVRLNMVAPEGWSCTTYTDVDLGSYANGDWFEQNVEYKPYVPTTVTITETYAPGTCEISGPWKFSWNYNQREEVLVDEQPGVMLNSLNKGYYHHDMNNMGSWDNGSNVWDLENNCPPGNGSVTPEDPATPASEAPVVTELPQTGPGGTITTFLALVAALGTYGAVYFLQPKKRYEQ